MSTELEAPGMALAPVGDVSGLVRLAIERGVDVEVLERLVALQERVTERNARAAFFEAMANFQEECPEIRKSKTASIKTKAGASYGYQYAPLEEITRTIRPVLRKHGLSYNWNVSEGGKSLIVSCVVRHLEGHQEQSSFPVPVDSAASMSEAQKNGAALTYGQRMSLISILGLTTAVEDKDATGQRTGSAETISQNQAADLQSLLDEVRANKPRFLGVLGVEQIADIPVSAYATAVRLLEQKREAPR